MKNNNELCIWTEDGNGNWETSCEDMFVMETGTPDENHYRYCRPHCGKRIKEVKYEEAE